MKLSMSQMLLYLLRKILGDFKKKSLTPTKDDEDDGKRVSDVVSKLLQMRDVPANKHVLPSSETYLNSAWNPYQQDTDL